MQTLVSWQSLIVAALGSFFTIVGLWWNNRSNLAQLKIRLDHEEKQLKLRLQSDEKLQRQKLSKEKLEELYCLVNNWGIALLLNCDSLRMLMQNKITLEQHRDSLNLPNVPEFDLGRLEMIAGIYGGTLQTVFNGAMDIKDKILLVDIGVFECIEGQEPIDLITPLTTFQREFVVTIDALKKEIIKAAKDA